MNRRARTIVTILVAWGALAFWTPTVWAQTQVGPARPDQPAAAAEPASGWTTPGDAESINPLTMLRDVGALTPGATAPSGTGERSDGLSVGINIMLLLTVVALVPSIMLMCTCFVRIMVVLALLRQALGTQSLPPSQVITGLALFMTALVMQPTLQRVWDEAVVPYRAGEIRDYDTLWDRGVQPMRDFMFDQIEATGNWSSLYMILNYRGVDTSEPEKLTRSDVSTVSLVPAYMLSELKVAFLMGFRVYLPFLVIDMVIASLLISMSMMMLPPVLISLPFKLMLFVLVDGWQLVVGSLLESFVVEGAGPRLSAEPGTAMVLLVLFPLWIRRSHAPPEASRKPFWARRPAHALRRVDRPSCP